MLQALINFFKPYKQEPKEPIQVKVEDTVKVEAPTPEPVAEVKVEAPTPAPEVKAAPAPKAPTKGRPKSNKPAVIKAPAKPPRKKK